MGVATANKKSLKCKYIVCSNDYTVDLSYDCNVPKNSKCVCKLKMLMKNVRIYMCIILFIYLLVS